MFPPSANASAISLLPCLCSGFLGYLHRERGVPLEALSFSAGLPSSGREGVALLFDYLRWLHDTRDISVLTEGIVVRHPVGLLATGPFIG